MKFAAFLVLYIEIFMNIVRHVNQYNYGVHIIMFHLIFFALCSAVLLFITKRPNILSFKFIYLHVLLKV